MLTTIVIIILLLLGFYFAFRNKRGRTEIPVSWHPILLEEVAFYNRLFEEDQYLFRKKMLYFLNGINIEPIGFELEELDEILIASSAVIPIFYFENWQYTNLNGVILYPDRFNVDLQFDASYDDRHIGGLVGTGKFENKMILSRKSLHKGFSNKTDKNNTGIHEFVHLIDKVDGATDGLPKVLIEHQYSIPWLQLIHTKMEAINADESDIRAYGGTSEIEFFAVAAEYFFERPKLFRRKHPELYKMMEACFQGSSI